MPSLFELGGGHGSIRLKLALLITPEGAVFLADHLNERMLPRPIQRRSTMSEISAYLRIVGADTEPDVPPRGWSPKHQLLNPIGPRVEAGQCAVIFGNLFERSAHIKSPNLGGHYYPAPLAGRLAHLGTMVNRKKEHRSPNSKWHGLRRVIGVAPWVVCWIVRHARVALIGDDLKAVERRNARVTA